MTFRNWIWKMPLFSSTRLCFPVLILIFFVQSGKGIRYINGDFLIKDMDPVQSEPVDDPTCCINPDIKAPADALAEISSMTSDQFLEKFSPHAESGASEIRESPEKNEEVLQNLMIKYAPLEYRTRMSAPEISPVEEDRGITRSDVEPVFVTTNFRSARLEVMEEPQMAENARCEPRNSVVPMPKPANVSLTVWPQCTVVKRCGGCCGDSSLICKSTESRPITRKGMHLAYLKGRLQIVGQAVVTLTEDLACSCACRQNSSDCSVNQRFDASNCKCVCLDSSMLNSCGPHRVWDSTLCQCRCPNIGGACPHGFVFDTQFYCACLPSTSFRQSKRLSNSPPGSFAQSDSMTFARRRMLN